MSSTNLQAALSIVERLLRPEAFPHAVTHLEVRETHISWVILTGLFAYKIKKPVQADFIDASTLERRRHYCEEELRLNRRLAPELYLEVVAITRSQDSLRIGGGPPIEYAVRMRQFDKSEELPALLRAKAATAEDCRALGELLARFHLTASVAVWTGAYEKTARMHETVLGNLAQLAMQPDVADYVPILRGLIDWTFDNVRTLEQLFEQRERLGFVRECHGDLHAGNIVRLNARLVPFDCIEFDPDLRWIDVINDIAFLVMDLSSHEHGDLAFTLLNSYLEVTGDYDGLRLLPFYAVYRALVRAKVDAMSAQQVPDQANDYLERLTRRLRAAQSWTTPPHAKLVIMHGLSGSGKSWLSERLVPTLSAVRIRSDLERKRLMGVDGRTAPAEFGQGLYSPDISHRTYARLLDCAESGLVAGCNVIVDAAFLQAADREAFQSLARRLRMDYAIVSCQAESDVLNRRLDERAQAGIDPSDATREVLQGQTRTAQPFTPEEAPYVISASTQDANVVASVTAQITGRIVSP